jgi:hypothetical protein
LVFENSDAPDFFVALFGDLLPGLTALANRLAAITYFQDATITYTT